MSRDAFKRLRAGLAVDDRAWDELYPKWVRTLSKTHWTPVDVALVAAAWLVDKPGTRVLDIGSGAGKFCLVGALTTGGVFTGVEQRPHLGDVARELGRRHGVKRCRFVDGDAAALDWTTFDGFYLFNPFAEQMPGCHAIDDAIERSPERFRGYLDLVTERLSAVAPGARVVTYHGYGGELPPGWELDRFERHHAGPLALWVKRA